MLFRVALAAVWLCAVPLAGLAATGAARRLTDHVVDWAVSWGIVTPADRAVTPADLGPSFE